MATARPLVNGSDARAVGCKVCFVRAAIRALLRQGLRLSRAAFVLAVIGLSLALAGYLARDRWPALAGLTYLPLLPVGLAALAIAALPGAPRRARLALAVASALSCLWALPSMLGWHAPQPLPQSAPDIVRLLQWNVWGGGPTRHRTWVWSTETIVREAPDIVILSEAPRDYALARLTERLGPEWSSVHVQNRPQSDYWYKLVLASHWPVQLIREQAVTRGKTMLVEVAAPARSLRVLVVDGESDPTRDRGEMLRDVAEIVRAQARAGTPLDVLAGDFNAPSRSQGFDPIWNQGYQLAAASSRSWRATFPMLLPVLDIDHVLLRSPVAADCTFFSSLGSDHRGQLVRFRSASMGSRQRTD
jgi:endonuclease/exonuclease/phosphatase family metal-dependent hydrolase